MSFQLDDKRSIVAGVCAGLAHDLNVSPTIPRLIFIFMALWGGGGVLLYLILWLLMASNSNNKLNIG